MPEQGPDLPCAFISSRLLMDSKVRALRRRGVEAEAFVEALWCTERYVKSPFHEYDTNHESVRGALITCQASLELVVWTLPNFVRMGHRCAQGGTDAGEMRLVCRKIVSRE
jgi:hypothetical protein